MCGGHHHGAECEHGHSHHEGECGCGGHHGGAHDGECGCGGHHSHHGHEGCHQGHDWGWGGRCYGFWRRFRSREERLVGLEAYLKELEAEAQGVREALAELQGSQPPKAQV